jgi:ParB-like chromosome segregation protein Spo0J
MAVAIEVPFFRRKDAKAHAFAAERAPPQKVRPLRVARMLALAHSMQALLRDGSVHDQRELAELMGFTRARVTQLLDLTLLAPDIQEALLVAETEDARDWVTARELMPIAHRASWAEQRSLFARSALRRAMTSHVAGAGGSTAV